MAELADAQDLGSCGAIRVGSTPTTRTTSGQSPLRSVSGGSLRLTPKTALRSLAPPFNPEPAYAGLRGCFFAGDFGAGLGVGAVWFGGFARGCAASL